MEVIRLEGPWCDLPWQSPLPYALLLTHASFILDEPRNSGEGIPNVEDTSLWPSLFELRSPVQISLLISVPDGGGEKSRPHWDLHSPAQCPSKARLAARQSHPISIHWHVAACPIDTEDCLLCVFLQSMNEKVAPLTQDKG